MSAKTSCDVVVIGGGPAGVAAAIRLIEHGRSVCLLDGAPVNRLRVGESLPPAARETLRKLGAWPGAIGSALECPGILAAWGAPTPADWSYLFDVRGYALNLDRAQFDALLLDRAREAGVNVLSGLPLRKAARTTEGWLSITRTGEVTSRFAIDASGHACVFARSAGARRIWFDRLIGLVGWVERDASYTDYGLLVEATEHGWCYSLPLPADRTVVAVMTDADLLTDGSRAGAWRAFLEHAPHTRERVRSAPLRAGPVTRIAGGNRLDRLVGPGWLAAGDAAFSLDPLSSDGIARALESGLSGADAAHASLSGDDQALARYESAGLSAFSRYLEQRTQTYRQEQRWPASRFWRRRQLDPHTVFLPPYAILSRAPARVGPERVWPVLGLSAADISGVLALAATPRPAFELVRTVCEQQPALSDDEIIRAIQVLIVDGSIRMEAEPRANGPDRR